MQQLILIEINIFNIFLYLRHMRIVAPLFKPLLVFPYVKRNILFNIGSPQCQCTLVV